MAEKFLQLKTNSPEQSETEWLCVDVAGYKIINVYKPWGAMEGVLTKVMATVDEYLQTWKLKLSTTKTVSAAFYLNNKEAKRELKVKYNNATLPFCYEPKCLGVALDRSLTYHRYLESLRKKLTSRVALLRRLAGYGWGAGATTLRIATLALAHSTAEYCTPIWCSSAHSRFIDPTISNALWIVAGCLRPTPADNIPMFAGIQPVALRHTGAILFQARRAMEPGHLLHSALTHQSECKHTAPQIETLICTRRTTSHQFIWQQQHTCSAVGGSPMECGVGGQPYKTPHFHPRHQQLTPRNDPPKKSLVPA